MEVVGETKTIFDTGTTQIIGDPARIEDFFTPLVLFYGAEPAPQYGAGIYTSTLASNVADPMPHNFHHSPLRFRYSHLRYCWREGSRDFS